MAKKLRFLSAEAKAKGEGTKAFPFLHSGNLVISSPKQLWVLNSSLRVEEIEMISKVALTSTLLLN